MVIPTEPRLMLEKMVIPPKLTNPYCGEHFPNSSFNGERLNWDMHGVFIPMF